MLGRGSSTPTMKINAAMEYAIDQHKIPEELDNMKYKTKVTKEWQDVTIKTMPKNRNDTVQMQNTSKRKMKVKRNELRYKIKRKHYIHLLRTCLAACYTVYRSQLSNYVSQGWGYHQSS